MEPFADDRAYLSAELDRLDTLLYRYLNRWRANRPETDGVPGLYVSDSEVERILAGPSGATGERSDGHAGDRRDRSSPRGASPTVDTRTIEQRVAATRESGQQLRLRTLADRYDLDRRHLDAIMLALAPELDLAYEKVYAYLQDDLTRKRPTVGLIGRVCQTAAADRPGHGAATGERLAANGGAVESTGETRPIDPRFRLSAASPPVEADLLRLERPDPEASTLAAAVTTDRRIASYCLGGDEPDPAIASAVDIDRSASGVAELPLTAADREHVARAALDPTATPTTIELSGPPDVGIDAAARALCGDLDGPIVAADADRLLATEAPDAGARVRRETALRAGVGHLRRIDRIDADRRERLVRSLVPPDGHLIVSGEEVDLDGVGDRHVQQIALSRPDAERRRALWASRADRLGPDVDPGALADTFGLTRGQIETAIETARRRCGGPPDQPTLAAACRAQSRSTLAELASRTDPDATFEEIVLPAEQTRALRAVAAHVAERQTVYGDWGFADRFSLGHGVNVLFSGPSGTGKTLAAEIVAHEAGLDLFQIDLASVVSKYIGETESHLKRIFDEAAHSDAILFFDEADALFGERSEVSDSHDRYANVEVSYLLQRMEDHDGTVIMTTNLDENIDDAFRRRINLTVEFPRPDYESRYAIWQSIFPAATPLDELDYEFLAGFDLTGGNVKNVALTAAFLAADDADGDRVTMDHVVRALHRELTKTGRLVDPEVFGEYKRFLE